MSIYLIDRYQNAIPRAKQLQELKKIQLQECFRLMAHDSIGHLKTLGMSSGVRVWMETLQLTALRWKDAWVLVWIQLHSAMDSIHTWPFWNQSKTLVTGCDCCVPALFLRHIWSAGIEYWSVTSSNFLFSFQHFHDHISVEHDEKPSHTKFDMNWFMVARDMAAWIPN